MDTATSIAFVRFHSGGAQRESGFSLSELPELDEGGGFRLGSEFGTLHTVTAISARGI
jgi:hypothetical protein